ncbi:hypothetical protein HDU96_009218 [Phlyctochytrium bullatum]|nr:hypothetical protein HDU96_009218 [Phlyctochytrium bullatum]
MSTVTTAEIASHPRTGTQGNAGDAPATSSAPQQATQTGAGEAPSTQPSSTPTRTAALPRTIVIAVDGSKGSHRALAWALDNVVRPTDRILLSTIACAPSATWSDLVGFWEKGHSYGLEKAAEMEERAREFATKTLIEASEIIQARNLPTSEAFMITHEIISVPPSYLSSTLPASTEATQEVTSDELGLSASSGERQAAPKHPAQLIADLCRAHDADMLVIGDSDEPSRLVLEPGEEPHMVLDEVEELRKSLEGGLDIDDEEELEEEGEEGKSGGIAGIAAMASDVGGGIRAGVSHLASAMTSWLGKWTARSAPSLEEALMGMAPCPVVVVRETDDAAKRRIKRQKLKVRRASRVFVSHPAAAGPAMSEPQGGESGVERAGEPMEQVAPERAPRPRFETGASDVTLHEQQQQQGRSEETTGATPVGSGGTGEELKKGIVTEVIEGVKKNLSDVCGTKGYDPVHEETMKGWSGVAGIPEGKSEGRAA